MNQVRTWVQTVVDRQRRQFHADLRMVAGQYRFPKNPLLLALRFVSKELAAEFVRWVIRTVGQQAGLELSSVEVDILADAALAML